MARHLGQIGIRLTRAKTKLVAFQCGQVGLLHMFRGLQMAWKTKLFLEPTFFFLLKNFFPQDQDLVLTADIVNARVHVTSKLLADQFAQSDPKDDNGVQDG